MKQPNIGNKIRGNAERDAIHFAVAPVTALQDLQPGQHVGITDGGASARKPYIGIVDPFLTSEVDTGERFWLFLYPNTITSLRHDWTHPAFREEERTVDRAMAVGRLRSFADRIREDYETTLDFLRQMEEDGRVYGTTIYDKIPDEIWDAYEVVTGIKVANRAESFSCSC